MTLGAMTWTCLLLTAGAAQPDVWHLNQKTFQIPIRFDAQRRAEIRELDLYVSHDQGQTWNLEGRAKPTDEFFPYAAREDGPYWFTVAVIDLKGQQTPPDIHAAPVGQRIVVDTVRPDVKMTAERQGDTIRVNWAITEEHPKPETLKLEYAESAEGPWTAVAINPGPTGHADIQTAAAVTVRMQMQDMAENQGQAVRQVPGVNGTVTTAAPPPPVVAPFPPPVPPLAGAGPSALPPPPDPPPAPPVDRAASVSNWSPSHSVDPSPGALGASRTAPPPPLLGDNPPAAPAPVAVPLAAAAAKASGNQVVAFTQLKDQGPPPAPPGPTSGQDAPPTAPHGPLPPVQIVNHRSVKLEFDVGKYGPSGLGGADVFVTTNDGTTWDPSPVDGGTVLPAPTDAHAGAAVHGSVTVGLNQEGVTYGFYVVVKSKAGLGKPAPQPGDAPQIRVELDATPPEAVLLRPKADPLQPDTLILAWQATDKHLAANPITLEWSAQPGADGPWNVIGGKEMANTGQVRWRPSANAPPSVYLRLTVRDVAGNTAVAQTPEPVLIDLSVPEVSNIGLGGAGPAPSPGPVPEPPPMPGPVPVPGFSIDPH
jgi:hypothetical protein